MSHATDLPEDSAVAPATPRQNEFNLVWVDMEMTGLEPDTDRIIEIHHSILGKQEVDAGFGRRGGAVRAARDIATREKNDTKTVNSRFTLHPMKRLSVFPDPVATFLAF